MASAALIVREDGSFEATPELRELLHVQPGTRLELVQHTGQEIRFHVPPCAEESWHGLQGILASSKLDLNEERGNERQRELGCENLGRG